MTELFMKISGKVHGVGFRFETKRQADTSRLSGWARNAADGTVEILAQGEKENLEKLVAWAERSSPGVVTNTETEWREPGKIFSSFEISD